MKELDRTEGERWSLLAKYHAGEAGDVEKAAVEAWPGGSEERRALMQSGGEIMDRACLLYRVKRFDAEAAWERVSSGMERAGSRAAAGKVRWLSGTALLRVAASLLLALLLGSLGYYLGTRQRIPGGSEELVATSRETPRRILLPDGSVVTLNSHSRINYPVRFDDVNREVWVTGEAFFEVEPDATRPFVLTAGNARIRVLGTSFNVNARAGEPCVEVVVATGQVEVNCGNNTGETEEPLILDPGEKGILHAATHRLEKQLNSDPNVIAWKTHQLVFNQSRLEEVVGDLEKVYQCNIRLADPALNDLVYTAHFDDQTIDFILEVIRLTFNLELSSDNRQFILSAVETH